MSYRRVFCTAAVTVDQPGFTHGQMKTDVYDFCRDEIYLVPTAYGSDFTFPQVSIRKPVLIDLTPVSRRVTPSLRCGEGVGG
jgi:hypothetical protein